MFVKYPKLHHLWKSETHWIFDKWTIYIQEKIDWANLSIRMEDDCICIWSRSQIIHWPDWTRNTFNWAVEYVLNHEGINKYLKENPTHRLFGEWLVRHTIAYPDYHYKKFWLFDVMIGWDEDYPEFMILGEVSDVAFEYKIFFPYIFWSWECNDVTPELVDSFLWKTYLWGEHGEWITIKNYSFLNKFGRPCHAKRVTEEFHEKNAEVFGNHSRGDIEWYIRDEYITIGRLKKLMHKIEQKKEESNNWLCKTSKANL